MPRLWNDTIEAHRHAVRDAILDTSLALVSEQGLLAVTMSQIAEATGIGRATLYKYFPDVEAILVAWHERLVAGHLEHLTSLRDRAANPNAALEAVLEQYAQIAYHRGQQGAEIAALVHRDHHVVHAQQQLIALFRDLISDAAAAGHIRQDATPNELATYCLHALTAAGGLPSKAAVHRLVTVTLSGMRPATP